MSSIITFFITVVILMTMFVSIRNKYNWVNQIPELPNLGTAVFVAWLPYIVGITLSLNGVNLDHTPILLIWTICCIPVLVVGYCNCLLIMKKQ